MRPDLGHTLSPDSGHTLSDDPAHWLSPAPGYRLSPDPGHTLSFTLASDAWPSPNAAVYCLGVWRTLRMASSHLPQRGRDQSFPPPMRGLASLPSPRPNRGSPEKDLGSTIWTELNSWEAPVHSEAVTPPFPPASSCSHVQAHIYPEKKIHQQNSVFKEGRSDSSPPRSCAGFCYQEVPPAGRDCAFSLPGGLCSS